MLMVRCAGQVNGFCMMCELHKHINHCLSTGSYLVKPLSILQKLRRLYYSQNSLSAKKVKVAHTRLPSEGFWSSSRCLAVSLQVTRVINPEVGCHYFLLGPQLPLQPLRGLLPVSLLVEQRHDGCVQFA